MACLLPKGFIPSFSQQQYHAATFHSNPGRVRVDPRTSPSVCTTASPQPHIFHACGFSVSHRERQTRQRHQTVAATNTAAYTAEEEAEHEIQINNLNEEWAIPGIIEFADGMGGLPCVVIRHPGTNAGLQVYLHGATVAQWLLPGSGESLWEDPTCQYNSAEAINSGLSLFFPQYRTGALPLEHGFAHRLPWEVIGAGLENLAVLQDLQEADTLAAQQQSVAAEGQPGSVSSDISPHSIGDTGEDLADEEGEEEGELEVLDPELQAELEEEVKSGEWSAVQGSDYGDLAPFVVFRLTDCEETHSIWPHKFELLKKITLMQEDDPPDVLPGPADPTYAYGDIPSWEVDEEEKTLRKARKEIQQNATFNDEVVTQHMADPVDEEDEQEEEEEQVPLQIKMEVVLKNLDEPGSPPMEFQMAALARFLTADILKYGENVKVLGLGAQQVFDYSQDERFPRLGHMPSDFLSYQGQRVDITFINSADCSIALCPGNRTHFELITRDGFRDVVAYHPGVSGEPDGPEHNLAALGVGHVSTFKRLAPGETWCAEVVLRFHNRYWPAPIFGEDTLPPLNPLPVVKTEEIDTSALNTPLFDEDDDIATSE